MVIFTNLSHGIQQNVVHGSILPTEGTKTGCFCAHTHLHTE